MLRIIRECPSCRSEVTPVRVWYRRSGCASSARSTASCSLPWSPISRPSSARGCSGSRSPPSTSSCCRCALRGAQRRFFAPSIPGGPASTWLRLSRQARRPGRVAWVPQIPFERILTLGFETDAGWVDLVAELMARHSNLILVQDGLIAGAFKLVPEQRSSVRQVLPGLPYRRPPAGRPSPAELTQDRLRNLLEASREP